MGGARAPEVNIFSRKTPAKPESVAAASAATTPSSGEAPVGVFDDLASSDWTSTTPRVRSTKESHWTGEKVLWRSTTVKKAVESDLSWYSTCAAAAERLEMATKMRLFWMA